MRARTAWCVGAIALVACRPEPDCFYTEYETVTRGLTITSSRDLRALAGRCILVDGDLRFEDPRAKDLTGLERVIGVAGSLVIHGTDALETTEGLDSLEFVARDLRIEASFSLAALDLPALRGVGGSFELENLPSLATLSGTPQLSEVGGDLLVHHVDSLPAWDFEAVEWVGRDLLIGDNESLREIDMEDSLFGVGRRIAIAGNASLESVRGFEGLDRVGNDIEISGSPLDFWPPELCPNGETVLPGSAGGFSIEENPRLQHVSGFGRIHHIEDVEPSCLTDGSVEISNNAELVEVQSLPNLQHATELLVTGNAALTTVTHFAAADFGLIMIAYQPRLVDTRFLMGAEVRGAYVYENPDVRSLDGLSLAEGASDLYVADNAALERVGSLDASSMLFLSFVRNPKLVDIDSVRELDEVVASVFIVGNSSLDQQYAEDAVRHLEPPSMKVGGNDGWVPPETCPWTQDGDCDEPQGFAICRAGTDEVDCAE